MASLVIIRSKSKSIEYQTRKLTYERAGSDEELSSVDNQRSHDDDSDDSEQRGDDSETADADADAAQLTKADVLTDELLDMDDLRAFRCAECRNVVAAREEVISKTFFGRTGRAFLMNGMFNVRTGSPRKRRLMTGIHTITDVTCNRCDAILGWKYIQAMEPSQRYKEGKYIMEKAVVEEDDHDDVRMAP